MTLEFRSSLFTKGLLLIACVLELGAVHEKDILRSFREFLNNLPDQPNVYTDGVVLNSEKLGNHLHKIEVRLHESKIDPTSTKLVQCTFTIQNDGKNIGTIPESGYRCDEELDSKYEYVFLDDKANQEKRIKRLTTGYEDKNPKDPKYMALANVALQKYIQDNFVENGSNLIVSDVYSAKEMMVSGLNIEIKFDVTNVKDNNYIYMCDSTIWTEFDGQVDSVRSVRCYRPFD